MLMQMSEQEVRSPLGYAVPLICAYRSDVYVLPNESQQKFQLKHKLAVHDRNLDWSRFWLQDYEGPDPAKRERYAHWAK